MRIHAHAVRASNHAPTSRSVRARAIALTAALLAASSASSTLADLLFDQIGSAANLPPTGPEGFFRYGSQAFVGEPQFDVAALDDFSLAEAASIHSVSTVIAGYGAFVGYGGIQGFTVRIFASPGDAASGFGTAIASATVGPSAGYEVFGTGVLVQLALPGPIELSAGHYWMSVQAINSAPSNGQIGVVISDLGDGLAYQANPGGGFGIPGNLLARPVNLAYRIEGTVVPTPAAAVLLLAAARARHGRRREGR